MRLALLAFALLAVALLAGPGAGAQTAPDTARYGEDFDALWAFVHEEYAYLSEKATDWPRVREVYRPLATAAADDRAFLNVMERALGELYDDHASFGVNNTDSPRLVPSGTDLWGEWRGGEAVITDVRAGSEAERAGVRPGLVVRTVGGVPVAEAAAAWAPRTLPRETPEARDRALRVALAGTHAEPVRLAFADGTEAVFTPGVSRPDRLLSVRILPDGIGHVRIHNTLGDFDLVAAFDSALLSLADTRGLVLDLRDTPGGGNTTVARGLMGRLIMQEQPYQRHERPADEQASGVRRVWVERVVPRGALAYRAPVVVLVGRWTGSMGEGLAVGLHGMGRAEVVGTRMAGLAGGVTSRTLPRTGIAVWLPTEHLLHIDGTAREAFVPDVLLGAEDAPEAPAGDAALAAAVARLLAGL